MVKGIENFKKWFQGYEEQYVIIGGTACDLLLDSVGTEFRATKDIDIVLIIEAVTPEFGKQFWEYVKAGGYEHCNRSTGKAQFYRFTHPKDKAFPFMIELFTKQAEKIVLPEGAVITPLPMDDDISSLSAILLDEAYYDLMRKGAVKIDGVTILDAGYLILFKAKAWLDLAERKANGERVDSKDVRKHKNDIYRLSVLLGDDVRILVNDVVYSDLQEFLEKIAREDVALEQFGIHRTKEQILDALSKAYVLEH